MSEFKLSDSNLMPFGDSDFVKMVQAHNADPKVFFIDKTKMIETLLESKKSVTLFTRPRRFGKSTNISMLHYFFGVPEARLLFENLAIGQNKEVMEHQGKYAVISLTLKNLSPSDFPGLIREWKNLTRKLFLAHQDALSQYLEIPKNRTKMDFFNRIIHKKAEEDDLKIALEELSQYLSEATGKLVWILIDEYDAPLYDAYVNDYYSEMIKFMRVFLGDALKGNQYLHACALTGILRVAKESLFSSINNITVDSIFNEEYAPYFGFTTEEVKLLLFQHGMIDSPTTQIPKKIQEWYNGYKAGNVTLYNPWAIVNYIDFKRFDSYWVNSGSDLLIREFLANPAFDFAEKLEHLLLGESISEKVSPNLEMSSLGVASSALWSLLVATGYLKIISLPPDFKEYQELAIPNEEIKIALKQVGMSILDSPKKSSEWFSDDLYKLLEKGKTEGFFKGLKRILEENASFHDLGSKGEIFYHGLLLGIISSTQESHRVLSNRESGHGRYDLAVVPKSKEEYTDLRTSRRALLFEIKRIDWVRGRSEEEMEQHLQDAAVKALEQVEEKNYVSEFRQYGASEVIAIGIAFSGKLLHGEIRTYPLINQ